MSRMKGLIERSVFVHHIAGWAGLGADVHLGQAATSAEAVTATTNAWVTLVKQCHVLRY